MLAGFPADDSNGQANPFRAGSYQRKLKRDLRAALTVLAFLTDYSARCGEKRWALCTGFVQVPAKVFLGLAESAMLLDPSWGLTRERLPLYHSNTVKQ